MSAQRVATWMVTCDAEDCLESYDGPVGVNLALARVVVGGEGDDGTPGWKFVPGRRVNPFAELVGMARSIPDRDYCPKHRTELETPA